MMKHELKFSPNHMICPKCLEILARDDVEGFGKCPYCDYAFEFDTEMEDFLLRPVVKRWMAYNKHAEEGDLPF